MKYHQLLEIWYRLEKNPIHQKVMATIHKRMDEEDYTWSKAIAASLRGKKYLFDPLLEEEEEEEESTSEEEDDRESMDEE